MNGNGNRLIDPVIGAWTQALIAGGIVITALVMCSLLIVRGIYVEVTIQMLGNILFLVVGFYFSQRDTKDLQEKTSQLMKSSAEIHEAVNSTASRLADEKVMQDTVVSDMSKRLAIRDEEAAVATAVAKDRTERSTGEHKND